MSSGHKNLVLHVLKVLIYIKLCFALALAPPPDQPTNITALKKINKEHKFKDILIPKVTY